jgi:hypothetical protein
VSNAVGGGYERGRVFATRTLALGLASPALLVAGFGWVPFGWELGALTAVASISYGVRTFRRPHGKRSTALATTGIFFASLALLVVLWISIAFALNPPE